VFSLSGTRDIADYNPPATI